MWAQTMNSDAMNTFVRENSITASASARGLGLGNAGLAGGDAFMASTHNPALAMNSKQMFSFNGGFAFYNHQEDRAFPYNDNFGGFVDYGSYYFQNNWYGMPYGQFVFGSDLPQFLFMRILTGYLPFKEHDYDYFEEVRSPNFGDDLLAYNIIKTEGTTNMIPLVLAAEIDDNFNIGMGFSLLTGDITHTRKITAKKSNIDTLTQRIKNENEITNTPIFAQFGATYQFDEYLTFAASFRSEYTVDYNSVVHVAKNDTSFTTKKGDRTMEFPARVGAGLEYRFVNALEARIMVDYYYEFWSNFSDNWNPEAKFEDTYNIRVGVEHIFFDDLAFRVGFDYATMRETRDGTRSIVTVGTGYNFRGVNVDMALGYSNNSFFQNDLFDNANYANGHTTRTNVDKVSTTNVFVKCDFTYAFDIYEK